MTKDLAIYLFILAVYALFAILDVTGVIDIGAFWEEQPK